MCSALDHINERKIVHRDVKLSNIMLDYANNRSVLFDFGLGHDLNGPPPPEGRVYGSPMFLAPEQAVGGPVDARTDLYSLGITLYRLTVGALPFYGERNELLHAHPLSRPTPAPLVSKKTSLRSLCGQYPKMRLRGSKAALISRPLLPQLNSSDQSIGDAIFSRISGRH